MFLMRSVLPEEPLSVPDTVAYFRAIQIRLFLIQPPGNIIFTYKSEVSLERKDQLLGKCVYVPRASEKETGRVTLPQYQAVRAV